MTADALATRARYVALLRRQERATGFAEPVTGQRPPFSLNAIIAKFWSQTNVG